MENCLNGYNSSILAYGQTGSGKTYTMLGKLPGRFATLPPQVSCCTLSAVRRISASHTSAREHAVLARLLPLCPGTCCIQAGRTKHNYSLAHARTCLPNQACAICERA